MPLQPPPPLQWQSLPPSLADLVVNRTWSLHGISPLTASRGLSAKASHLQDRLSRDLCHGSDYCRVHWLVTAPSDASDGDGDSSPPPPEEHRHLLLEFYVRESLSAAILLCFVETHQPTTATTSTAAGGSAGPGAAVVRSLGFVLVRGSRTTYELAFEWLEWRGGCAVQRTPFRPTPAQIADCAAKWTLLAYRAAEGEAAAEVEAAAAEAARPGKRKRSCASVASAPSNGGSTTNGGSASLTRPLVLTFVPPLPLRGQGLDTLSAVVTPADLRRLCRALQWQQMRERERDQEPDRTGQLQEPSTGGAASEVPPPLPVLRVLCGFVSSETGISLDNFDLTRASCSVASLGSDGRCKPHSEVFLHDCWIQILEFVRERHDDRPRSAAGPALECQRETSGGANFGNEGSP